MVFCEVMWCFVFPSWSLLFVLLMLFSVVYNINSVVTPDGFLTKLRGSRAAQARLSVMPRCLAMPRPVKASSSKPSLSSTPISGNDLGKNSGNNLLPSVLKRPRCRRGLSVTFFKATPSLFEERLTESRYVFAWIQFIYFLALSFTFSHTHTHEPNSWALLHHLHRNREVVFCVISWLGCRYFLAIIIF